MGVLALYLVLSPLFSLFLLPQLSCFLYASLNSTDQFNHEFDHVLKRGTCEAISYQKLRAFYAISTVVSGLALLCSFKVLFFRMRTENSVMLPEE